MAPSTLRRAIGAVKDQTSISIAKVSNSTTISDLDVAIVKATRHDEYPAEERHIREILSLTCYSRAYVHSCVSTLSRRLSKTRSWTVALKSLILIHRLLSDGDPAYEQEIFFATRRGTRMLNMSDFRDTSRSAAAWDFSAFVRTYARYLDERLEFRMHGRRQRRSSRASLNLNDDDDNDTAAAAAAATTTTSRVTPVREMKTSQIFIKIQHLQQLLERFLACRPTGAARFNRVVCVALQPLLKESQQIYYDLNEIMSIFIDRFMEMEIPECVRVHSIFTRLSKQLEELDAFYNSCKSSGISRPSDFPQIERITSKKLEVMDEFIKERSNPVKLNPEPEQSPEEEEEEEKEEEGDQNHYSNSIKALPPPTSNEAVIKNEEFEDTEEKKNKNEIKLAQEEEGDLLNLSDELSTANKQHDHDMLALALFDDGTTTTTTDAPAWEAFKDEPADWETALVQSASVLSGQRSELGGGFDTLVLNGMYVHADQQVKYVSSGAGQGSASSVALPLMSSNLLALPAPAGGGGAGEVVDPFAASLEVPAPAYVQMSEMEKKQRLLMEEQRMWQQYANDGMQGHLGMVKLQQYPSVSVYGW
ncbi:LOW QUALITY PROTEIN: putative clathrin assembly protein At1g03050 [Dioscorea cayenensis subsp. rotundata]|uniref:LOW QUALITY PROTEIN: putative clathrin assembly protein At1g03050 n=1 Tax=Dioscorea cayennensis subsp. rotundata TaxID=55577 RepID=A0AB40B4C9_DIOCR|nr:LOW QUALITY PROTEIN: putative clathrin assembly protein At1g03050 [Dioscorea cayenensis subsp. rotundata]